MSEIKPFKFLKIEGQATFKETFKTLVDSGSSPTTVQDIFIYQNVPWLCHPREGADPGVEPLTWIPAFAGTTLKEPALMHISNIEKDGKSHQILTTTDFKKISWTAVAQARGMKKSEL